MTELRVTPVLHSGIATGGVQGTIWAARSVSYKTNKYPTTLVLFQPHIA